MNELNDNFTQYVESLLACDQFSDLFAVFEKEVSGFGIDGVLYTYIPKALIDAKFVVKPYYAVSENYAPAYISHYADARFDRHDPLITAVMKGETDPISWWGSVCGNYMAGSTDSYEVIATSRDYGIKNGLTLPLMSGEQGIAGASFIYTEPRGFELLLDSHLQSLQLYTRVFHNIVVANSRFHGSFTQPLLSALTETELQLLVGLANGRAMSQIAVDIDRREKYLEQVMLSLRRKMSGVDTDTPPAINRNQLLYTAGLLNTLDYYDGRAKPDRGHSRRA